MSVVALLLLLFAGVACFVVVALIPTGRLGVLDGEKRPHGVWARALSGLGFRGVGGGGGSWAWGHVLEGFSRGFTIPEVKIEA